MQAHQCLLHYRTEHLIIVSSDENLAGTDRQITARTDDPPAGDQFFTFCRGHEVDLELNRHNTGILRKQRISGITTRAINNR